MQNAIETKGTEVVEVVELSVVSYDDACSTCGSYNL